MYKKTNFTKAKIKGKNKEMITNAKKNSMENL